MLQLNYISDAVMSSGYPYDIRDQQPDNYQYDGIGNMTSDLESGINNIYWNAYGKVTEVQTNDANIYYLYDGLGRRVRKRIEPVSGTPTTTWYILDAGGRNISTYTRTDEVEESQQELSLYGGSRVGIYRREVQEWGVPYDKLNNPWPVYTRFINRRQYEITDHLGSTRVVVNDRAITTFSEADGSVTYACADVLSLLNYYPGGQLQPAMHRENTDYRYGYNTQERDDDFYGPGNFYTAEFWEYDSRIWRRWNLDPIDQVSISNYATFRNNPVWFFDWLGNSPDNITVDDDGVVVSVEENNLPNRFFTKDGTELTFNDIEGVDNPLLTSKFQEGDRLFFNVGKKEIGKAVIEAGFDPLLIRMTGNPLGALFSTALGSYSGADFAHSFLAENYPVNTTGSTNRRLLYLEDAGYFRFGESNTIYNLYDAGNFLWGSWMRVNDYSHIQTTTAAHLNEIILNFRLGDTQADQRAIDAGFKLKF